MARIHAHDTDLTDVEVHLPLYIDGYGTVLKALDLAFSRAAIGLACDLRWRDERSIRTDLD